MISFMKKSAWVNLHLTCFLIVISGIKLNAQTNTDSDAVKNKLIALRNDFVNRIEAMGYHPSLKPPEIKMDNPPSFGNYNDSTNTLHTSNWGTLSDQDRELFIRAGKKYGYSGEDYFESSAHRWIFIHELGHWWRACQHQVADSYSSEMAADRIDIAYWRETDTAYSNFSRLRFENYLKAIPDPVPDGQNKQAYLNENYGKLPIPVYIWYQATMIVDGYNEKPIASFRESISRAGNKN
jgi:hypothetical protein